MKSLGESGDYNDNDGDEDAVSWVAKLRKRDEAKRKAEEKVVIVYCRVVYLSLFKGTGMSAQQLQ